MAEKKTKQNKASVVQRNRGKKLSRVNSGGSDSDNGSGGGGSAAAAALNSIVVLRLIA